jgi:CheY-like chemotaxis protein
VVWISKYIRNKNMQKIKDFSSMIFGVLIVVGILFIIGFLIEGGEYISEKVYPYINGIGSIIFTFDILVFLPLSFFKKTRVFSVYAFLISSYVFGVGMWFFSFIVTYALWGWLGILIGLFLMGVGVMPVAVVASLFAGQWAVLFNLLFGFALTYGTRAYSIHLANKADKEAYQKNNREVLHSFLNDMEKDSPKEYIASVSDTEKVSTGSKRKILMVEPDRFIQNMYKKKFEEANFDFVALDCAEEDFIDYVSELKPDMISTGVILYKRVGDKTVSMPDGLYAVEALKKDRRTAHIPVFFLTNQSQESDIKKAESLGIAGYLISAEMIPSEVVKIYSDYLDTH